MVQLLYMGASIAASAWVMKWLIGALDPEKENKKRVSAVQLDVIVKLPSTAWCIQAQAECYSTCPTHMLSSESKHPNNVTLLITHNTRKDSIKSWTEHTN